MARSRLLHGSCVEFDYILILENVTQRSRA